MPQAIDLLISFNSFLEGIRSSSKQELEQFAELVLSEVPPMTESIMVRKIGFIQIHVAAQIKDLLKQGGKNDDISSERMGRSNASRVQKCAIFR